ncbi:lipase family protein [Lentzea sp. PSKA42]|uniref:Lipase family protein n=1 Tax=Lentzea indica TaxID=2604800 RepID=A0ABX1FUS3_9PSEU|nr:lipase family protein [Lentzea indica]NKE62272.1 lipase family protein [Lentzea indica]
MLASSLLNPGGVVKFEAAMAVALDGPNGLTATSAGIGLRGEALKATRIAYEMADELAAKGLDAGRWFAGLAVATNPIGAALVGGGAIATDVYLNYDGNWEKWLVDHPGMVDTLIGMSPGMLSALGIPVDLATTLDLLGATYADGEAVTTRVGDPHHYGAPDNLEDLMEGLAKRNTGMDAGDTGPSNIDVKIIKNANGDVTGYVVDIPGTKNWNAPWEPQSANDSGVNVDAMAGNNTVLQQGIQDALRKAGAHDTGAPVMLVGHSQGGIVAAQSTSDLISNGYNVTHVVTAGSPVGRIDVPSNVQVLSLENRNDIVPHLDASDNPDSPNRTTVTFDNQTGTVGGNHKIEGNYTGVAEQLDNGSNPSVNRFKESAGAFFNGDDTNSVTQNYHVARKGVNDHP